MASRIELVYLLVCFLLLSYKGVEAARGLSQKKLEIEKQIPNLRKSAIETIHNDATKDPLYYWKSIMKDQPIPEAIKDLLHQDPPSLSDAIEKNHFVKDFDSRHSAIIYHANVEPKKHFAKDFDTRHSAIIYHANVEPKNHFAKDFDTRHSAIIYHANVEPKNHFAKDFDTRHSAIIYHAKVEPKNHFVKDFDTRPSAIIYHARVEPKEEKSLVKDFEPMHTMELKEGDFFFEHSKQG